MTRKQQLFSLSFIVLLALPLLLAADAPRLLGIAPPAAGILGMLAFYLFFREKPALPVNAIILTLPILALAFLSTLWAIDSGETLERSVKLASIFIPGLMLLALAQKIDPSWLRPYAWMLPAATIACAVMVSVELIFDAPLYRLLRGMEGTERVLDHVFNRGANTAVLCLIPALALLRHYTKPAYAYSLFAAAFAVMALSIESQSAQLALLLALLFYFAFPYRIKAAWIALAALIAALITAAPFLAVWAFSNFSSALDSQPFFHEAFAGARLEIWDYVSRYALQKPFFGHGLEACRVIEDFDSAQIYLEGKTILHPHNFALQLWLEFGIIGAAAGIAFCLGILRLIYKLPAASARIALPAFIAALSVASTAYGLWQGWWIGLLFLLAALIILAIRMEKAE